MSGQSVVAATIDGAGAVSRGRARAARARARARRSRARPTRWSSSIERLRRRAGALRGARRLRARRQRARDPGRPRLRARGDGRRRRHALRRLEDARRARAHPAMRPDALLLDEPTNHLDIESILWLESFLQELRRRARHDLARSRVHEPHRRPRSSRSTAASSRRFSGNYEFYVQQRAHRSTRRPRAQFERQQAMLAKEEAFIARFKARASHAAQVQSRVKKLEKIERVEPPRAAQEAPLRLPARRRARATTSPSSTACRKAYGTRVIYDGARSARSAARERWCVMGVNGAGKSTLLKLVAGAAAADAGRVDVGASVKMGYFAQHAMELLDADEDRLGDARSAAFPHGVDRLAAHARRRVRLLGRRHREAVPHPLRRREGAPRARADALRPAELPRARRADQPPRHRHQGDADRSARRLRGHDALRLARSPLLARALEPRARAHARGRRARTAAATPSTSTRPGARRPGVR